MVQTADRTDAGSGRKNQEVTTISWGLSVATVCDGQVTGTYQAGLRDFDRNLPVDANTKYRIASISKFVMTTAMMTLCDRKLLDLDEDVSTYLGFKLRNPAHPDTPITVRMLLLHTGSINEGSGYDGFLMATYNNVSNPPTFAELLVPGAHITLKTCGGKRLRANTTHTAMPTSALPGLS
ncbi:MAG: beta-lactamase family protein [Marinilabiliales bacterium]|nr:beta-lactamase family protein [Marinilabiliales bacterium]